jgi:SAM-dependent methyltransferase
MDDAAGAPVPANREMAATWDGDEGASWAADADRYDRAVRDHHVALLAAAGIGPPDVVLDVGCGNGETTCAAARLAAGGAAHGIDLSSRMLAVAARRAAEAGLGNVTFEQGDAQVHELGERRFTTAISRFGMMFFADPVAAFHNVAKGLVPGATLATVAWRAPEDNEWVRSLVGALAAGRSLPLPPIGVPGPFGLADAGATTGWLRGAGYVDVRVERVDGSFWVGDDAEHALRFVASTGLARGLTQGLGPDARAAALATLRRLLEEHTGGDGVTFASSAWVFTARAGGGNG